MGLSRFVAFYRETVLLHNCGARSLTQRRKQCWITRCDWLSALWPPTSSGEAHKDAGRKGDRRAFDARGSVFLREALHPLLVQDTQFDLDISFAADKLIGMESENLADELAGTVINGSRGIHMREYSRLTRRRGAFGRNLALHVSATPNTSATTPRSTRVAANPKARIFAPTRSPIGLPSLSFRNRPNTHATPGKTSRRVTAMPAISESAAAVMVHPSIETAPVQSWASNVAR